MPVSTGLEQRRRSRVSNGVRAAGRHRLARVAMAGAASAAVDFAIFNVLLWGLGGAEAGSATGLVLLANTAAFGCAMVVNYTLNARYSFGVRPGRRSALAYVLFTALGLVFYSVNLLWIRGVLGAEDALLINISKVLAMGLLVVWNYFGYQRFVFRPEADR